MNIKQLENTGLAMVAWTEGKKIQIQYGFEGAWDDWLLTQPPSDHEWTQHGYRPKPEPASRPWNRETIMALPFGVIAKESKNKLTVVCVNRDEVWLGACDVPLSYEKLLKDYTLNNGSICGVES